MNARNESLQDAFFSLPVIGEWAGTILALLPMLLFIVVGTLMGFNITFGSWYLIAIPIVLCPWLLFLERRMNIKICTPYVPIKWLWIMPLFALMGIAELFGWS